jgi:hypothetical protein
MVDTEMHPGSASSATGPGTVLVSVNCSSIQVAGPLGACCSGWYS